MSLIDQVTAQLATIDLKDDDVATYIAGIIEEDSIPDEEKHEAIAEFLSATTDKPTDSMIEKLLADWKVLQKDLEKTTLEEEAKKKAKALEAAQAREKARQLELEKERENHQRHVPRQLTKEERAEREKLMKQYGYDLEEIRENEQGEAEIVYKDKGDKRVQEDPLLSANRNTDIIKQQEQRRREQMKEQSEKEKERNKLLLEKQRLKEEKEKRRTMKKEKRRM